MSKAQLNEEELKKTTGGYGDPNLCLPVGIYTKYRVKENNNWETHCGIIMSVEQKEDGSYVYDIFREMSSIHDIVKSEDIYQL